MPKEKCALPSCSKYRYPSGGKKSYINGRLLCRKCFKNEKEKMDSDRLFLLHTRQMKAQAIVQLVPNNPSLLLLACMFDKVAAKSDALAKEEVTEDQANRDMARIQYLQRNGFNCFAASLNCPGAEAVAGRHVDTNFGNRRFVGCVMKRFREHLPFTQIALDHVWCKNAHSEERWSPDFYKVTLPKLRECLPMPGPDEECGARPGAIYIPCCIAAFVNVYAYREYLLPFYAIEYLTHDELKRECTLYRATEGIDLPKFGKEKDQARLYAFTEKQLPQYEPPPNVTPAEVLAYAQRVDPTNKPMICLSRISATEGALHPIACDAKHFEQRCGRCADCMAALDQRRLEERIARRSSTCAGIGDGLFVTADIDEGDPSYIHFIKWIIYQSLNVKCMESKYGKMNRKQVFCDAEPFRMYILEKGSSITCNGSNSNSSIHTT